MIEKLFSLANKTALITGASGGIGRVLAIGLAEAGAVVGVHGTNKEKVSEVGKLIQKVGERYVPLVRSLDTVEGCRALVVDAERELGRIDILINCVGMNRRKPVRDVAAEDFEHIVAVNLRSVFFTCQSVYPIMQRQGGGKIINVGSVTSTDGVGGVSVYGATKAAVAQLTKTMALEWAKDNIQVNCLAPGFMMTPLTEQGLWGDAHRKQWLLDRIPARRSGKPEELVGAALGVVDDVACDGEDAGWHDAPWIGLTHGELVRSGRYSGCHCWSKPPNTYAQDGCGQFNVFEVVNDNNSFANFDVFSTNLVPYAGYIGEGPCGGNCNATALPATADLLNKANGGNMAATTGAVSGPGKPTGAAFVRPDQGFRYFVTLLDENTRTVQIALVHPSKIPPSIAALLPNFPLEIQRVTIDALVALRLPG